MLFHATYSKQRYFYISKLKHITPPHTTKYIFLSCFFFSLFCFQPFSFIFCVHFMIFVHCIQYTIYVMYLHFYLLFIQSTWKKKNELFVKKYISFEMLVANCNNAENVLSTHRKFEYLKCSEISCEKYFISFIVRFILWNRF